MRDITLIVIHCADTYADMDIGAAEIREWHLARGWDDIGYHRVIRRNGDVELGRDDEVPGAHVRGHNASSIGICMVGGKARGDENRCNFTAAQWRALHDVVKSLTDRFPAARVVGHHDLDPGKTCPTFNVTAWGASR